MYRLKKIYPLSLAYILASIYLIFGLLMAVLFIIIKQNPAAASAVNQRLLELTYWQIILLYPIAYALGGFLTGIIIGFLYNLIAPRTGGVAFELTQSSIKKTETKEKK